uniref:PDZ domain-containing protein n=1 Tax=Meloidogyne hapla TaxID=6305 RepID=A0A1I8BZC3_MELHA
MTTENGYFLNEQRSSFLSNNNQNQQLILRNKLVNDKISKSVNEGGIFNWFYHHEDNKENILKNNYEFNKKIINNNIMKRKVFDKGCNNQPLITTTSQIDENNNSNKLNNKYDEINKNIKENKELIIKENKERNLRLVITDVQEGSPASGHLLVGDTILTVNGRKISNLKNFYQVMGIAHPTAVIEIRRPRTNEELPPEVRTDPSDNLPADVRNTLVRRNGYHYSLVTIDRVPGIRLGLSIKTRDNRVCVSDVKADSMCSPHLKIFDHIVYVSGVRVTQADVAQTLLVKSMKETNRVDLVIGRPTSRSAIAAAMIALAQEDAHDPAVRQAECGCAASNAAAGGLFIF